MNGGHALCCSIYCVDGMPQQQPKHNDEMFEITLSQVPGNSATYCQSKIDDRCEKSTSFKFI